jgi:O-antigen ligase
VTLTRTEQSTTLTPTEPATSVPRPSVVGLVELLATPIAVACALLYAAQQTGGRDTGATSWTLITAGVAFVSVAPWARLSRTALLLTLAVNTAALLALVTTGVLRSGAVAAGTYVLATTLLLTVLAWARTPQRRAAIAALVAASGAIEFAWSFVPWWGRGDVSSPMVGTFYWHNQFAAALLAPAVLGVWLALTSHPRFRAVGWIAVPLCVAGVLFSTSRATIALTAVALVATCVVCWIGTRTVRVLARAGGLVAACAVVTYVLPGPPFFAERASALSATAARSDSLGTSWTDRLYYGQEAIRVFLDHPWGVGYGRFSSVAAPTTPSGTTMSALIHNGLLQALVDGGLLLAIPVLIGCGVVLWRVLRRLPGRRGASADRVLVSAAAIAAIGLFGHSLFDFDWTYPSLAAMFGIVAALALARGHDAPTPTPAATGRRLLAVAVTATVVVAVAVTWGEQFYVNVT